MHAPPHTCVRDVQLKLHGLVADLLVFRLQAEFMADDLEIDMEKMSLWTKDEASAYFESGGEERPE